MFNFAIAHFASLQPFLLYSSLFLLTLMLFHLITLSLVTFPPGRGWVVMTLLHMSGSTKNSYFATVINNIIILLFLPVLSARAGAQ